MNENYLKFKAGDKVRVTDTVTYEATVKAVRRDGLLFSDDDFRYFERPHVVRIFDLIERPELAPLAKNGDVAEVVGMVDDDDDDDPGYWTRYAIGGRWVDGEGATQWLGDGDLSEPVRKGIYKIIMRDGKPYDADQNS